MDTSQTDHQQARDSGAAAAAMGIDDTYISTLIDTFYSRVREDNRLGPIFENAIGDDWGPHLARMKDFWASVALGAGRYSGRPVPKHVRLLPDVAEDDFARWLGLFETTLRDTAPTPAALPYFMERAQRIAQSLRFAMFGLPSLSQAHTRMDEQ